MRRFSIESKGLFTPKPSTRALLAVFVPPPRLTSSPELRGRVACDLGLLAQPRPLRDPDKSGEGQQCGEQVLEVIGMSGLLGEKNIDFREDV